MGRLVGRKARLPKNLLGGADSWEAPGWDPDHWRQVYESWHERRPLGWAAEAQESVMHWCQHWPMKHSKKV